MSYLPGNGLGALDPRMDPARLMEAPSDFAKRLFGGRGDSRHPQSGPIQEKVVPDFGKGFCDPGQPARLCIKTGIPEWQPCYTYTDGAIRWQNKWNANSEERKERMRHAWRSGANRGGPVPTYVGQPPPGWRWCRGTSCISIPHHLRECTPANKAELDRLFPGGEGRAPAAVELLKAAQLPTSPQPKPVLQKRVPAPVIDVTAASVADDPQQTTPSAPKPAPPATQPAVAAPQASSSPTFPTLNYVTEALPEPARGTLDIFGISIPYWLIGAGAVAGFWFLRK